jgi:hypothetical protein
MLPALESHFNHLFSSGIPTKPGGGNHTKQFAQSARTEEAHEATMLVTKGLALTGVKVIMDDGLFKEVSAPRHYCLSYHRHIRLPQIKEGFSKRV